MHKMKISSKFLSYFKLDQSYSLLNCRNVNVLMEFFRAQDVRETMALDGNRAVQLIEVQCPFIAVEKCGHLYRASSPAPEVTKRALFYAYTVVPHM